MKGAMIHDIVRLTGLIILVFVIMFWGVSYGVGIVAKTLVSSPYVVQDSLTSYLSIGCMQENMVITLEVDPYDMKLKLNDSHVQVIPESKFYGSIERGGNIKIRKETATAYVRCDRTDVSSHERTFREKDNTEVSVIKTKTDDKDIMRIGVE